MKQYDTYKDSGIAWIGEIPSEWEVCRLKNISIISSGDIISKEEYMDNGQYPIIGSNGEIGRINKINNNKNVLTTGRVGSIGTVQLVKDSWITDNALIINITSDDNIRYIYYALPLLDYQLISTGTAQPLISASALKTQSLPMPSVKDQHSIASFLDTKCGEIDALISLQEEMISELQAYKQSVITEAVTKGLNPNAKMKDSGVEWIGEIPEGWPVCRIKNVCIFCPTNNNDIAYDVVGYAPMNTIRNGHIEALEIETEKLTSGLTYFENGDIVMAKVTPCFENGNIAIASNLKNGRAYGSSELFVFRAISVDTSFLYYAIQNEVFRGLCVSTMTGTGGLKRISPTFVVNSFLPYPPLSEQHSIATYLDEKTSQIDSLISLKQQKIQELKDYKKSIIYEYVTGKKRV